MDASLLTLGYWYSLLR